jgi:hypothetical protein
MFDPSRKQSVHRNVWCHPVGGPGLYDATMAGCQRAAFTLLSLLWWHQGTPSDALDGYMLPAGFGAATVPQSSQKIRAQGVAYLPVIREGP